jgi:hypothetical protein
MLRLPHPARGLFVFLVFVPVEIIAIKSALKNKIPPRATLLPDIRAFLLSSLLRRYVPFSSQPQLARPATVAVGLSLAASWLHQHSADNLTQHSFSALLIFPGENSLSPVGRRLHDPPPAKNKLLL